MTVNRYGIAALAGVAALVVGGGGTALASKDGGDKASRCQARVARIAERRGITVEQLEANVKARLLARVDAALAARRITSDRAAELRDRIENAMLCSGELRHKVRHGVHRVLAAAADYLGFTPQELREQLPGTSLAALAAKQGKTVTGLEAAILDPARDRLARAVAEKKITQEQANRRLDRLQKLVDRLVNTTFPEE
jgi:hypothetical protein